MNLKSFIKKHKLLIAILISILVHILFFTFFTKLKFPSLKLNLSKKIEEKLKEIEENKDLTKTEKEKQKKEILIEEEEKIKVEEELKEKKYNTQIIFAPHAPIIKDKKEKKLVIAHTKQKDEDIRPESSPEVEPNPILDIVDKDTVPIKNKLEIEENDGSLINGINSAKEESRRKAEESDFTSEAKMVEIKSEKIDLKKIALNNLFKKKKELSKLPQPKLFFEKEPDFEENEATTLPIDENDNGKTIVKLDGLNGICSFSEDGDEPAPMEVIQQKAKGACYTNKIGNAFVSSLQSYYHPMSVNDVIPSPVGLKLTFNKSGTLEKFDKIKSCGNEKIDKIIAKSIKKSFPLFKIPDHLQVNSITLYIEISSTTISIHPLG